jgi:hypothetical protein
MSRENDQGMVGKRMHAIHRTTREAALSILESGFDINHFGAGAGAGSGEPAGIFVSPGDGEDFRAEDTRRGLGFNCVLEVDFSSQNMATLTSDERIASFKRSRIELLGERYGLSAEEAQAVASYKMRILKGRPDLMEIADWLDTRPGEVTLAKHSATHLLRSGIDTVAYRDPWQHVDQIIILDPSIVETVKLRGTPRRKPR